MIPRGTGIRCEIRIDYVFLTIIKIPKFRL